MATPTRWTRVLPALVVWAVLLSTGAQLQGPPREVPPIPEPRPGTLDRMESPGSNGRWRTLALSSGEALSFHQEPPLVFPRDGQGVRLSDFVVAGDVARVRFDRWNGTSGEGEPETWERERTDTIAGRLVSVFQPAWSADVLQPRLASA
ncbi:MAG TPA: hypothetical protein VM820_05625, partial [Vicinamibacterales bacterium]|nr:hypothetical protein [Vicinamibacterales bacterium]